MKNLISVLFIIGLNVSLFSQQKYSLENAKVDSLINKRMFEMKIPGLALAVIKDGKVIKKNVYGLGNIEWESKITEHSNFQIASCTKLLTSTLVIKTIYNKKLDLDLSISKYVDSVPAGWEKIKVKDLISHSSGLPDIYESNVFTPIEAIVKELKTKQLQFTPGTKQQYGSSDLVVLSYILEKIYRKPFVQILRDEVILPLNMKDGSFDMEFKVNDKFMRTELITEKVTTYYNFEGHLVNYKYLYPQYTYPAGGYFASIDDMANWAIGLDTNKLFPLKFADGLIYQKDIIGGEDATFSKVGWVLENDGKITYGGHTGGPGLGDILRFPKEKLTIIVLSNDGELLPGFARAVANWYIKGLVPKFGIENLTGKTLHKVKVRMLAVMNFKKIRFISFNI